MTATHRWESPSGSIDGFSVGGRSFDTDDGWVYDREPETAVEPLPVTGFVVYSGDGADVLMPAVAVAAMREPAVDDETTLVLILARLLSM